MPRSTIRDLLERSSLGGINRDPHRCASNPSGLDHEVESGNPMMTGRCFHCRQFVGYIYNSKQKRFYWTRISEHQARLFGLMGVRRP